MKTRIIVLTTMLIMAVLMNISMLYAWTGEPPFGSISRALIAGRSGEMITSSWKPYRNITPWNQTFYKGTTYTGIAYSQDNPQENWAEFLAAVSGSNCNNKLGNDCSGFVSICWKLPTRYVTGKFESDATSSGGYVSSHGDKINPSNSKTITNAKQKLKPGDALVSAGHIVLFESLTASGIKTREQTPPNARYKEWTWSGLSGYRPICRNSVTN